MVPRASPLCRCVRNAFVCEIPVLRSLCTGRNCCAQVDLLENKSLDDMCEKLDGKIDVLVHPAELSSPWQYLPPVSHMTAAKCKHLEQTV